jgi:hypothetical protein
MSIVKRNYSTENILQLYREGGIEGVIRSMKKVDAFFCEGEFAQNVVELFNQREQAKMEELIQKEIENIV